MTALVLTALLLLAPLSAAAHTAPVTRAAVTAAAGASVAVPGVQLVAGASAATSIWLVLGVLAAGLLILSVPRRLTIAVLVVVLGVLAFETGVHAVHHLGDSRAAARCPVASATPHLGGATGAATTVAAVPAASPDAVEPASPILLSARFLGPVQGRAPPSIAS